MLKNKLTPQEFCTWFQGFLDYSQDKTLNSEQVRLVKERLQSVFTKVTGNKDKVSVEDYPANKPVTYC